MTLFKKHPRLILLAALMPVPMILSAHLNGAVGGIVIMTLFFAATVPMLIVRMKGELSMYEFMAIVGIMIGSWTFLVFGRAIIFGLLGREL